jgi:hypothetical protein
MPCGRVLNGGTEAEFFRLAHVGDTVSCQSTYADIGERMGSKGPMVLAVIQTDYTNQDDALLARVRMTLIFR